MLSEARAIIINDHPGLTMTGTGRGMADPFVIALAASKVAQLSLRSEAVRQKAPVFPTSAINDRSLSWGCSMSSEPRAGSSGSGEFTSQHVYIHTRQISKVVHTADDYHRDHE